MHVQVIALKLNVKSKTKRSTFFFCVKQWFLSFVSTVFHNRTPGRSLIFLTCTPYATPKIDKKGISFFMVRRDIGVLRLGRQKEDQSFRQTKLAAKLIHLTVIMIPFNQESVIHELQMNSQPIKHNYTDSNNKNFKQERTKISKIDLRRKEKKKWRRMNFRRKVCISNVISPVI